MQTSPLKIFDFSSRSISRELTISLFLLLILVEGALLAYVYHRQSRFLLQELEKKADGFAANLAEVLIVPIWDFDDEQIGKIGAGFAHNALVHELVIVDTQGKALYKSRGKKTSENRIHRTINLVYKNQVIGRADLFLSLDAYKADLAWLRNTIALILAGSLIVIFIATGILLGVFMRRPLKILQKGIDRVATGDYAYGFAEIHHRELSGIAGRFSEMAHEIRAREHSLQEINKELQLEIAERKRAEEKIRESEAKSRALLDAIPDMMFQLKRNGTFLDFRGGQKDLYMAPEAFLGKDISELLPDDISRLYRQKLEQALATRRIQVFEYELPVKGKRSYFECRLVAVSDNLSVAIVRNITESKIAAADKARLEEQLRQAQKMEAIGTLAGGVAHDLNNVLSGIVSYPELLLMDLPEDSPMRKPILTIQESGEKAAHIVQDLLTLARRGVSIAEVANLNPIITDYLKSPEYQTLKLHHPTCQFEVDLDQNLLNNPGSAVHMSKIVMNLVSNAVEAITDGGKVRISTENHYIDRPIRGYDRIKEGDYVALKVSDNGTGIFPEDLERIFEPFYTKKRMGRSGTGLGMAVVWGTVKDHHGYIDIQSEVGKGSTVIIYLPATRQESKENKAVFAIEDYMGNGESILVVDDVQEQREIASGMLTKLGYSVMSVASGEEAVEYMRDNLADLLVLDMIMDPGMDGLETYRKIIDLHPGQKAIITSGFSETDRVKEAERLGVGTYVKKPYLLEKIGIAVRTELTK